MEHNTEEQLRERSSHILWGSEPREDPGTLCHAGPRKLDGKSLLLGQTQGGGKNEKQPDKCGAIFLTLFYSTVENRNCLMDIEIGCRLIKKIAVYIPGQR